MSGSEVRQRGGRPRRPADLTLDLVAAKWRGPLMPPGTVWRSAVIERLMRGDPGPIVSVAAPAGYGKTTLLSQWAERDGRAFAWVSVGEAADLW
jgi:LuxR family transcriptional regulator, maltose regulon positive regulatory protein